MDAEIADLVREEYRRYCEGKEQGERLMTLFYRDVITTHCMVEVQDLEMHEVFKALFDDPRRQ